ncbi:MAG: GTPase HflX [Bacteroidota bacterium]|nr:GTPase HflX [Bacteroidota bacterium]
MKLKETAVLVGVNLPDNDETTLLEHLNELEFLAQTAGAVTIKKFAQNLETPHPKFFVGTGKLQEIVDYVTEHEIDIVIFDDELTPSQLKNIETKLECKILDRNNLILDIFANRAQTAQAKTQVDLAQCEYLLPRLTKMWTHLSRQKGGIGMKGPGEKEIETDRRIVREKIILLKERLKLIDKQNITQRKQRKQKVRVSLVGYTNAGKSSLMNVLSDAVVMAEDKLFATLDTTVRKVVVDTTPFLLSDTVGFIRKLPHSLVESFKSTLDEVKESDILIHVVDFSHRFYDQQIKVVKKTLDELESSDKPTLLVYNKIDRFLDADMDIPLDMPTQEKLLRLENSYLNVPNSIFISVTENLNINVLRQKIKDLVIEKVSQTYGYVAPVNYEIE